MAIIEGWHPLEKSTIKIDLNYIMRIISNSKAKPVIKKGHHFNDKLRGNTSLLSFMTNAPIPTRCVAFAGRVLSP